MQQFVIRLIWAYHQVRLGVVSFDKVDVVNHSFLGKGLTQGFFSHGAVF